MSRHPLQKLGFVALSRYPSIPSKRLFHPSHRQSSAVTLPLSDAFEASSSGSDSGSMNRVRDIIRKGKRADLMESLSRELPNPSRVWGRYMDLLSCLEFEQLPMDIHQAVLRKCVPPTQKLRVSNARRLQAGNIPQTPHIYESRFQLVIRNMRTGGHQPTLDDYHFILEQFAAVGHHTGVMNVYEELTRLGLEPKSKTYGLCLQAIAHRQTLPCHPSNRPRMLEETTKMCTELVNDMWTNKRPFASVNFDLAMRILKEDADAERFSRLVLVGYGIDLSNPDRSPLDYLEARKAGSTSDDLTSHLPAPLPFSTSALNTIVDMLGRLGDVSKLVQAFEVLTVPLPPQANQHFSSSFDDDDDFGVTSEVTPTLYQAPYTEPNTTTYNILIRHLGQLGHVSLIRHYVLQAMHLDMETDWSLHRDTVVKPREEILAPRFSINRGTLLPAFGLAHRSKNMELMRWIQRLTKRVLRRKKARIRHYLSVRARLEKGILQDEFEPGVILSPANACTTGPIASPSSTRDALPAAIPTSSTFFTSASSSSAIPSHGDRIIPTPVPPSPVLDIDLDAPPLLPRPPKILDIEQHLTVLRRDVAEISNLEKRIEDVIGRTIQRVKERLGRRVWAGKDIYLKTHDKRSIVSRTAWGQMVNFQPAISGSSSPLAGSSTPRTRRRNGTPESTPPSGSRTYTS